MNITEMYRNKFLAERNFYTGGKFTAPQAWKGILSNKFYTGDQENISDELNPQPETLNQYLGIKEMSRQQASGRRVGTSPLTWKMGRRKPNRYSKYL